VPFFSFKDRCVFSRLLSTPTLDVMFLLRVFFFARAPVPIRFFFHVSVFRLFLFSPPQFSPPLSDESSALPFLPGFFFFPALSGQPPPHHPLFFLTFPFTFLPTPSFSGHKTFWVFYIFFDCFFQGKFFLAFIWGVLVFRSSGLGRYFQKSQEPPPRLSTIPSHRPRFPCMFQPSFSPDPWEVVFYISVLGCSSHSNTLEVRAGLQDFVKTCRLPFAARSSVSRPTQNHRPSRHPSYPSSPLLLLPCRVPSSP